jgi:hypothetical protein
MPQWQGYKAVMERNPTVLDIQAVIVHKNDTFAIHDGQILHEFDPFDENRIIGGIGDIKGGYCKITYRDGRPTKYHIVSAAHIDKCRKCAQTQDVWKSWPEQMILKTIYRDTFARQAVSVDPLVNARIQKIIAIDDAAMGNDPGRVRIERSETTLRLEQQLTGKQPEQDTIDATPIDCEPMLETIQEDDANNAESEESVSVNEWLEAVAESKDIEELNEYRRTVPASWSNANRQTVVNAIDMRIASLTPKGKR